MATPPVEVEFTAVGLEQVKQSFKELAATSEQTKQSIEEDAKVMATGFRMVALEIHVMAQTGRLIAEFGEEMGILDKTTADTIGRTLRLISIFGGLMSTLSTLTKLTQMAAAAEWLHVAALKAKAIAAAIAHGISSLGAALPVIAIAATAGAGIALAATGRIPSRELGGIIPETGIYGLHRGEFVLNRETLEKLEGFTSFVKSQALRESFRSVDRSETLREFFRTGDQLIKSELLRESLQSVRALRESQALRDSLQSIDRLVKSETLRESLRSTERIVASEKLQKLISETEKVTPIILPGGIYEHIPQVSQRQAPILVFDIHDNRFASDYDADRATNRIIDKLRRFGMI